MNTFTNMFNKNAVMSVDSTDCYDEIVHERFRVFLVFPKITTIECTAGTSAELYDVLKYFVLTHFMDDKYATVETIFSRTHIFLGTKPIKREAVPLSLYGVKNSDRFEIRIFGLLGGLKTPSQFNEVALKSAILLPTYSHVAECERAIVSQWVQQSAHAEDDNDRQFKAETSLYTMVVQWLNDKNIDPDFIVKLMEDINVFIRLFLSSKDTAGCIYAIVSFIKFRTGKALFTQQNVIKFIQYFRDLFNDDLQQQSFETVFASARDYLNKYDELRNAPIFKKLYKMGMYALSFSVFDAVGIDFNLFHFTTLEAEAMKRKFHMGPNFIHTMLETLLFICERGYQCIKTGSLDPIYHSGSTYEKWFEQAALLKSRGPLLGFPEAHGFTLFEFLADIRECIDKGEAMYKHANRVGEYEKKMLRSLVNDLKMILSDQTTKREAQKERDAPFCVCLYGGSSIGKTTITDMLFLQYGKTFDLPLGSEFKYTHNPTAKYWDGFNSSQWFVIMDDVAFMHPNKATAGDPSVMETIQTNNRVAFVPDQADLADKGRTPFRARVVIATTNCEDLNAVHYFQTPLAMQRRFPYTIDVRVKQEYIKDECMLDSSLTSIVDGEWPNYWEFIIKKPVPHGTERKGQRATLVEVEKFTEVDDFLAWFSRVSIEHERIQKLIGSSSLNMSEIKLCKQCFRSEKKCVCLQTQCLSFYERSKKSIVDRCVSYLMPPIERSLTREGYRAMGLDNQRIGVAERRLVEACSGDIMSLEDFDAPEFDEISRLQAMKRSFRIMGEKVQNHIGNPTIIATVIAACAVIGAAYKLYTFFNVGYDEQGSNLSKEIGSKPVGNDETNNVWFRDDYELSSFDVSSLSTSWNSLSEAQVVDRLSKNVISIVAGYHSSKEDRLMVRLGRAVCLAGHIYMTNNHNMPSEGDIQLQLIVDKASVGITRNITVRVTQGEIFRFPKDDVCIFRLRCLPTRADITSLFVTGKARFKGNGVLIGRTFDGAVQQNPLKAMCYGGKLTASNGCSIEETWKYSPTEPTVLGDCGSLVVCLSGMGPLIRGIHALGQPDRCFGACAIISREMVESYIKLFPEPLVVSNAPLLSSESAEREVSDLHSKSVFRYIEQGTANVYGSFGGFKPTPKSRVVPTLIQASVLEEGYEVKHDKPVMKGWGPWRKAAVDMVKPVTQMDVTVLTECKQSFLADILENLPKDQLDEIKVYDDVTTLNGAAGVKFVDKMNRHTSMGDPWKKGKKYFLRPIPEQDGLTEPMEFTEEIQSRINTIIETYHAGKRFMPSFCGHLKDDPTTFKKIQEQKTRVFCGGPGDWSFVVRKYFLSLIRVIQNNKYIFETAVGTNACSTEWGNMHSYLTQFGEDRIVAGDYRVYDKKMCPDMILACFDILRDICKAAGYTVQDLLVMQGVAEDTAFPLMDFNGDLVEMYGSNPSGHPLTVIINSIANSLYMRYCYAVLSPKKTSQNFKQDVALMTYGDDNVMGISKRSPFFDHTTIQKVLYDIGVDYTMADKEAASVPYLNISQVSFLKREWRWDEDVGAYLAPLDEESIGKCLTVCVRSKSLSAEYHAIAVMESMHREYFYYGKEVFNKKSLMFQRIVAKNDLELYTSENSFPTWEQFYDEFWKSSRN